VPGPLHGPSNPTVFRDALGALKRFLRPAVAPQYALTADVNNLNPTGFTDATTLIVKATGGPFKITGLLAGALGDEITIKADFQSDPFILMPRDSNSLNSNWLLLAREVVLEAYQSISFRYTDVGSGTTAWVPLDDRFGTAAARDASEFALAFTDTGIQVVGGAIGGVAILPNVAVSEVRGMSTGEYAYASGSWQLWVYPAPSSGAFTLDVRKLGFTAGSVSVPAGGNSIVASAPPTIAAGSSFVTAGGSQGTWTGGPIVRGDMITVVPTLNTAAVQQYVLLMEAIRAL